MAYSCEININEILFEIQVNSLVTCCILHIRIQIEAAEAVFLHSPLYHVRVPESSLQASYNCPFLLVLSSENGEVLWGSWRSDSRKSLSHDFVIRARQTLWEMRIVTDITYVVGPPTL